MKVQREYNNKRRATETRGNRASRWETWAVTEENVEALHQVPVAW